MTSSKVLLCVLASLLVFQLKASCDGENNEAISNAIHAGDFSRVRLLAQESLHTGCKEDDLAKLYQWQANEFLERGGVLTASSIHVRPKARSDNHGCWNFNAEKYSLELWDRYCSEQAVDSVTTSDFFVGESASGDQCYKKDEDGTVARMCCELAHGSSSYLRLPALKELALRLRVNTNAEYGTNATKAIIETYDLEQDGFLRKFDPAGVLWPTGYLLSLCVAAPRVCGVPEIYEAVITARSSPNCSIAVELGSGIGASSIALARTLERILTSNKKPPTPGISLVVATDKALQGLALTMSNSRAANASVRAVQLDHYNLTALLELRQDLCPSGFSILLGSSLQSIFDESTHDEDHHLWSVLDLLLDSSNPNAIALLAHTVNSLQAPGNLDSMFRRIRTISGNHFGMSTRYSESSDFNISVFRRRQWQDQEL